jgi:hypothetical protein
MAHSRYFWVVCDICGNPEIGALSATRRRHEQSKSSHFVRYSRHLYHLQYHELSLIEQSRVLEKSEKVIVRIFRFC